MAARQILNRPSILVLVALAAALLVWLGLGPASAGPASRLPGDANCDGTVNSIDAALVLQYDAALIDSVACSSNADLSFDFVINSLDAALILQSEAGLLARCDDAQDGQGLVAKLALGRNQTTFSQGEAFSLTLSIINCGDEPVTRQYMDAQLYDFLIRDAGGQDVWLWSHDWGFILVISYRTFEPGRLVTYGAVWDQQTNDNEPVPPGTYEVLGYDAACRHTPLDQCDLIDSVVIEIGP